MKNTLFLLLVIVGLSFTACQSENSDTTAATKQNVEGDDKKFAPKVNSHSPVAQPANKTKVANGTQSIKRSGSNVPLKAQERRNNLKLKSKKGIMQQRQVLNKKAVSKLKKQ